LAARAEQERPMLISMEPEHWMDAQESA